MLPLLGGLVGGIASIFGNQSANNSLQKAAGQAMGLETGLFNKYSGALGKTGELLTGTPGQNETWTSANGKKSITRPFGFSAPAGGSFMANHPGWKETSAGKATNPGFLGIMNQMTQPGSYWNQQLLSPIDPNNVENTPGYKFTLGQGLESTQNSFAAQGLGSSGAAMKGAANYATGLAQNTYQQQFQNAMANRQQQFSELFGGTQLGTGAQENLLGNANLLGGNIGNIMLGMGQSQAGSTVASGNTLANMFGNLGQSAFIGNLFGGA